MNRIIEIKRKTDLMNLLCETNIDTTSWGISGHKSIENLYEEIINNDCVIREGPLREISIAVINIKKQGMYLLEKAQKMNDGTIRQRNKFAREKIKLNEKIVDATYRCMKEELNLSKSDFEIIKICDDPKIYTQESSSYPNLKTKYIHYDIFIKTDKLPHKDFETKENGEEHDPVDTHFWTWIQEENK